MRVNRALALVISSVRNVPIKVKAEITDNRTRRPTSQGNRRNWFMQGGDSVQSGLLRFQDPAHPGFDRRIVEIVENAVREFNVAAASSDLEDPIGRQSKDGARTQVHARKPDRVKSHNRRSVLRSGGE